MKPVGPGTYQRTNKDGRIVFYARPVIRGRRTWRALQAVKLRAAIVEAAQTKWDAPAGSFTELADLYLAAGCPDRQLQSRADHFIPAERQRVGMLKAYFKNRSAASLRMADLPRYHQWRVRRVRFGAGHRTVDKDQCTLSNILNYGVATGQLEINYLYRGRPRWQKEREIRHSRAVAPASAEIIHQLAAHFMDSLRSEVFAWQAWFAQFTGSRTSELLRLRWDATGPEAAGWMEGNMLFLGRRSKHGKNPWTLIGPEFQAMITAFRRWHDARFPKSPHFFPSPYQPRRMINAGAFGHALVRACRVLGLPHITPHGFRSFYVTKRRSDGATDVQIAHEIGDKTVSLMQTTYGDRPENWRGGKPVNWLPEDRLPAWQAWLPPGKPKCGTKPRTKAVSRSHRRPVQPVGKVVAGDGIEPPTQGFSGISRGVPVKRTRTNPPLSPRIAPGIVPAATSQSDDDGLKEGLK